MVAEFSRLEVADLYELREALELSRFWRPAAEYGLQPAELSAIQSVVNEALVLRDELEASGKRYFRSCGNGAIYSHRP